VATILQFGEIQWLNAFADLNWTMANISREYGYALHMMRMEAGPLFRLPLLSFLQPYAYALAGVGVGAVNDVPEPSMASNATGVSLRGGAGLDFRAGRYSVYAEASLDWFVGLHLGYSVRAGMGWALDPSRRLVSAGREAQPGLQPPLLNQVSAPPDVDVTFVGFDMQPVFPVLYKFYDENPIGSAVIANDSDVPITDVEVRLDMEHYIDNAKLSARIDRLDPGARETIDLYALFNDHVLSILEGDFVAATVDVEYRVDGVRQSDSETVTVQFYDRNSVVWDDDRKVATFVTTRDTQIQRWARRLAAMARREGNTSLSENFQTGIMAFSALVESDLDYVVDPSTAYGRVYDLATDSEFIVDYVQFARQTFDYRGGDCDDRSVCYATLLEAVGVPTAFITVPGHIYTAFKLDWSPERAMHGFGQPDDLIIRDDGVWVPVEVTMLDGSFLQAWAAGAREWRENDAEGNAELIPTSEAWETYLPVPFVDETSFDAPSDDQVLSAFQDDVARFIAREVSGREGDLLERISAAPRQLRYRNSLGVLYARYGLLDQAAEQFEAIVAQTEHPMALANLGNLAYLAGNMGEAVAWFERALTAQPDLPAALLGLCRANNELGNYVEARRQYTVLRDSAPELAAEFSYLELPGDESARASDAASLDRYVVWGEDDE
jgi:hypothetical protein